MMRRKTMVLPTAMTHVFQINKNIGGLERSFLAHFDAVLSVDLLMRMIRLD